MTPEQKNHEPPWLPCGFIVFCIMFVIVMVVLLLGAWNAVYKPSNFTNSSSYNNHTRYVTIDGHEFLTKYTLNTTYKLPNSLKVCQWLGFDCTIYIGQAARTNYTQTQSVVWPYHNCKINIIYSVNLSSGAEIVVDNETLSAVVNQNFGSCP